MSPEGGLEKELLVERVMQEAGRSTIRRQELQHYQGTRSGNPRRPGIAVARRGIWTTSGSRTNFHLEGGKENRPKAIKVQLRPGPLARRSG